MLVECSPIRSPPTSPFCPSCAAGDLLQQRASVSANVRRLVAGFREAEAAEKAAAAMPSYGSTVTVMSSSQKLLHKLERKAQRRAAGKAGGGSSAMLKELGDEDADWVRCERRQGRKGCWPRLGLRAVEALAPARFLVPLLKLGHVSALPAAPMAWRRLWRRRLSGRRRTRGCGEAGVLGCTTSAMLLPGARARAW